MEAMKDAVKTPTKREWDAKEKSMGQSFRREVIQRVTVYMSRAIEAANREYQVEDQEFWKNLFLPTGPEGRTVVDVRDLGETCPPNPYRRLDFQGSNKYLLYGGGRLLSKEQTPPVYARDSLNFFEKFKVEYNRQPFQRRDGNWRPPGPKKGYQDVLRRVIKMRNYSAHETEESINQVSLEGLDQDLKTLKALTEPISRCTGWEQELEPVKVFWSKKEREFQQTFGKVPVFVEEIAQELFTTETLSEEQREALEKAIWWLHLDCEGGKIYGEDRRELKEKLRHTPAIAALLGTTVFQSSEEAAALTKRAEPEETSLNESQPLEQPLWSPLPAEAAARLSRAKISIPREAGMLSALLESFTLLVDESIFLSEEGRELLIEHLTPLLMKRNQRLYVDESVIATLFQQFRNSAPYTQLELADAGLDGLDSEQIAEMQEMRRQIHKSSKTAIKTLRFMRTRRCLEVVSNPTDSTYSYENFFYLAQAYPAVRFLMLTHDRQLAEELKSVRGRNVVVLKPQLDGNLLPYRATRSVFTDMLNARAESAVGRAGKVSVQAEERLPNILPPIPGERLMAELADGTQLELRVGKELGRGGEGAIYETSRPELAAKVYFRRDGQRLEKLKQMVKHDPGISGLCWPKALLYNAMGEWLGFLMPKASGTELAMTVFHPGRGNRNIIAQGWNRKSLAVIAANIAAAFAQMHEKGILMGDINPRNFLVASDCSVYLVDCDSYQFGGFACPVGTILYTPPEVHREMRARGKEHYGYTRTEDHERYSLAVLLFEILMLGKAPYESRNNNPQDVQEAIISGDFPYPYHADDEEAENRPVGKVNAPVGQWRQIWSHTTYLVKTGFYNTFTNKNRLSVRQWEEIFREYARQIELGHSSDELVPRGYKDTSGREGEDGTKMVNLICQDCGLPFNLAEDVWQKRKRRGEPDLCSTHWEIRQNFQRREKIVTCGCCGASFVSNVAEWMERVQAGKPMLCPNCTHVQATCSRCGRRYQETKDRVEDLQQRGKDLLCPDCFEEIFPKVICQRCGTPFRPHKMWLDSRQRSGKEILCKRCDNELKL